MLLEGDSCLVLLSWGGFCWGSWIFLVAVTVLTRSWFDVSSSDKLLSALVLVAYWLGGAARCTKSGWWWKGCFLRWWVLVIIRIFIGIPWSDYIFRSALGGSVFRLIVRLNTSWPYKCIVFFHPSLLLVWQLAILALWTLLLWQPPWFYVLPCMGGNKQMLAWSW